VASIEAWFGAAACLDGSALIAPDQVAAVRVQNLAGHTFVTANA
jgi:hypothetical protein